MSLKKIIVVGQLPPPIHGQSLAIERITKIKSNEHSIEVIPLNCSSDIESVGRFQVKKLFVTIRAAWRVFRRCAGRGESLVYFPPASPAWVPVFRDALFFLIARLGAGRWIFHFHAGGLPEFLSASALGRIFKPFYPSPRASISMSRDAELSPGAFFGGKDFYIPYGLEVPVPFRDRGHLEQRRMLFVGNLFVSKGVLMCLEAIRSLRGKGVDVYLDLVGGDVVADKPVIEAFIEEHELEPFVVRHGVLSGEAKWSCFEKADLFVFPSQYPAEKFPNVLIEALGAGLPLVSTKWRGIPELVGDDCEGSCLVDCGDQAAFEAGISNVLEADEVTYRAFRRSSRMRYEAQYTLEKFEERVLAAFDHALAAS